MLNEQEQKYGNDYVAFNSCPAGDINKVAEFIYASDEDKIVMIKNFINDVVKTQKDSELLSHQKIVDELVAENKIITEYINTK